MSEAFFSLLVFVLLMVGTPGPANMLAMIGGARLGLRECLGFIAGLTVGKIGVNVLFGVGFGLLPERAEKRRLVPQRGADGEYGLYTAEEAAEEEHLPEHRVHL